MSDVQAWVVLAVLVVPSLVVVFELRAAWRRPGSRVHAHSDGTVHSHGFVRFPHERVRWWARYRAWEVRVFGPEPEGVDDLCVTLTGPREVERENRP